jgi:hypothetical protein
MQNVWFVKLLASKYAGNLCPAVLQNHLLLGLFHLKRAEAGGSSHSIGNREQFRMELPMAPNIKNKLELAWMSVSYKICFANQKT